MRRAAVLLALVIVPTGAVAQSPPTIANPAPALYLYAWYPEIGALTIGDQSPDRRLVEFAELARLGRFKEADALLGALDGLSFDSSTGRTVTLIRAHAHMLRYGDPLSAVSSNPRLGDVAILQGATPRPYDPALRNPFSNQLIRAAGPALALLDDVHEASVRWQHLADEIRRSRISALVEGRTWQPDTRDAEGIAEFSRVIRRVRSANAEHLSDGQVTVLVALVSGQLRRAEGRLTEAHTEFERGLQAARALNSPRGELLFLTLIGDVLHTPFGNPETFGFDLDTEWDFQGALFARQEVSAYRPPLPPTDVKVVRTLYEDAERVRSQHFQQQYEARLAWRLLALAPPPDFYQRVQALRDTALREGDVRFGNLLWGAQAGSIGDSGELDRAVSAALDQGDALNAFRILDYVRANSLRATLSSGSTFAAIGSLTAAAQVAVKHTFTHTSGDMYFTLARLYNMVGQIEQSIDFSERAIDAYRTYLSRAGHNGTTIAATWLLLSYQQLAASLMAKSPGEVFDLNDRLGEIEKGITGLVGRNGIGPEMIKGYEEGKRLTQMQRALDTAWEDAPSCEQYQQRLMQLASQARVAGFTAFEHYVAGWTGQCGASARANDRPFQPKALADRIIAAYRAHKQAPTNKTLEQIDIRYRDAVGQIADAIVQDRADVIDAFVERLAPIVRDDPEAGGIRYELRYERAMAQCARALCDGAAAELEALLNEPNVAQDTIIRTLYALVDVESKRGDAAATLFALERLWAQLHRKELTRTGVSRGVPESAELDALERKSAQFSAALSDNEKARRDFLRSAQRLARVEVPAPTRADLQAQLDKLPPHTTVLVYHLSVLAPIVVRVSDGKAVLLKRLRLSPFELARLKRRLRLALVRPADGWEAIATSLWTELLKDVGEFPDNETIAIAAPSAMSGLPFEVMAPEGGVPLGRKHPIVYLGRLLSLSTGTWQTSGRSVIIGDSSQPTGAIVTDTSGATIGRGLASPTNRPPSEADEVAALLKSQPFDGQDSASLLGPALADAQFIHVTAHAIADRTNVYASSLLTRGVGLIQAWQLFGFIRSPELVVLSGCETSPQAVAMLDAFTESASGARWVVGAQWDLDENTTRSMTTAFYTALVNDGKSPAAAMQSARNQTIEAGYAHPFYWAPFQVMAPSLRSIFSLSR